ncbi:MAG: thioredoxin [Actinomycetota bacterium]
MAARAVTGEAFERVVLDSEQPVIVDFWAPWRGPCLAVAPLLDAIANERQGELKVIKVYVDEEPELAERYSAASIPTILLFRAGSPVAASVGARRKTQLENALGLDSAVGAIRESETTGRRRLLLPRFGRDNSCSGAPGGRERAKRCRQIERAPSRAGCVGRTLAPPAAHRCRLLGPVQ